jgi:hypothetical protein
VGVDDPAVTIAAGGFFIPRCHNSDGRTAITPLADHPVVSRRINFPWKLIEKLDKSEKVKKNKSGPVQIWIGWGGILENKKRRFLPKSAPPLPFNIPVPSSRNVLLFCTPSAFLLFSLTILAHMCLPVSRIMYLVM